VFLGAAAPWTPKALQSAYWSEVKEVDGMYESILSKSVELVQAIGNWLEALTIPSQTNSCADASKA
jgi:hypothetical protein